MLWLIYSNFLVNQPVMMTNVNHLTDHLVNLFETAINQHTDQLRPCNFHHLDYGKR